MSDSITGTNILIGTAQDGVVLYDTCGFPFIRYKQEFKDPEMYKKLVKIAKSCDLGVWGADLKPIVPRFVVIPLHITQEYSDSKHIAFELISDFICFTPTLAATHLSKLQVKGLMNSNKREQVRVLTAQQAQDLLITLPDRISTIDPELLLTTMSHKLSYRHDSGVFHFRRCLNYAATSRVGTVLAVPHGVQTVYGERDVFDNVEDLILPWSVSELNLSSFPKLKHISISGDVNPYPLAISDSNSPESLEWIDAGGRIIRRLYSYRDSVAVRKAIAAKGGCIFV